MIWRVLLTPSAQRERARLEAAIRSRIDVALRGLPLEPRPPGVRKLVGSQSDWRLRVGDYRVLFEVDDGEHTVTVWPIVHRRDAYR